VTGSEACHCHRSCKSIYIISFPSRDIQSVSFFLFPLDFLIPGLSRDHQRLLLWWLWKRYRVVTVGDIFLPIRVRKISVTVVRRHASGPGRRSGSGRRWSAIQLTEPTRNRVRPIGKAGTPITGSVTGLRIRSRRIATGLCRSSGTNVVIREVLSRWTRRRLQRWTRQDRADHPSDHGFRDLSGWFR